jgi:hypothetical protein
VTETPKPTELLFGPNKNARFSEGEDWDWKKPFIAVKGITVKAADRWHLLLTGDESVIAALNELLDGRFKTETFFEFPPEETEGATGAAQN